MNLKLLFLRKLVFFISLIILAFWMHATAAEPLTDLIAGENGIQKPESPQKVISTDYSKQNDTKMQKRIQQIFSELEELRKVKATVNNGIVTLRGKVDSAKSKDKALEYANQLEDVVEVKNQIVINQDLGKRIETSLEKLMAIAVGLIASLPLFCVAIAIVAIFWLVGKWLSSKKSLYRHFSANNFIADVLSLISYLLCILLGIIIALTLLDATALIGTFMGAAGIFGLAIGFAVRDTVENFISSLLLSIRNPFEVKDYVNIDGHEGTVARLTSRATILISPENNHVRIPNALVFKAVIINFTRQPERRFEFDVGVDSEQDLLLAQGLAIQSLLEVPGVLNNPKPMALVQELGDSNVILRIFAWVNQSTHSYLKVRSEAIRTIKEAFDQADIVMPEPIYNLRIMSKTELPAETHEEVPKTTTHKIDSQSVVNHTNEIKNVSADKSIEDQINKENAETKNENLLSNKNPKEL